MKKILILTEGQTEQILLKNIFLNLFLQDKFSMLCIQLKADKFIKCYNHEPPDPIIYFEIIDIGNDEKVLSFIRENEKNYFSKGFNRIIGLRDMYSERYAHFSNCYKRELILEFEENANKRISELENSSNIKIFFAVMECVTNFV